MLVHNSLRPQPLSMQEFSMILKKAVVDVSFLDLRTYHWAAILEKMAQIYIKTGTVQPADLWGALLADRLMHDMQDGGIAVQDITFDSVRKFLERNVKYPFPIFTASIDDFLPYQWMEVNPFVSGGDYLMAKDKVNVSTSYSGAYVPTFALGSCFVNGVCTCENKEKSVGSMMGIFGSPYDVSPFDILKLLEEGVENYFAGKLSQFWARDIIEVLSFLLMEYIGERKHLNTPRFLPTHVDNFLYGMDSIFKELPKFILSDAGFEKSPCSTTFEKGAEYKYNLNL